MTYRDHKGDKAGAVVNEDGKVICGAVKRNGGLCQQSPMRGHTRCKLHGAKAPVGPANGQFKHGRMSKFMPKRYRESFAANLADPDLASLRSQIALVSAREEELLQRIPTGEHGSAWTAVQKATENFKLAFQQLQNGSPATAGITMRGAMQQLQSATQEGILGERIWSELINTIEQKRKLIETETKREARLAEVMTPDQLGWLLHSIANLFRTFITDPAVLRDAIFELRQLIGGREDAVPHSLVAIPAESRVVDPDGDPEDE